MKIKTTYRGKSLGLACANLHVAEAQDNGGGEANGAPVTPGITLAYPMRRKPSNVGMARITAKPGKVPPPSAWRQ